MDCIFSSCKGKKDKKDKKRENKDKITIDMIKVMHPYYENNN